MLAALRAWATHGELSAGLRRAGRVGWSGDEAEIVAGLSV